MDQQPEAKRKRGRPIDPNSKRQTGGNLTFRTRPTLKVQLRWAAIASGRSISEEIERRLEASFDREDLETMLRRVVNER